MNRQHHTCGKTRIQLIGEYRLPISVNAFNNLLRELVRAKKVRVRKDFNHHNRLFYFPLPSNNHMALMYDELIERIEKYYRDRNLKWPDKKDAAIWLSTEVGELLDSLMRLELGWVRNTVKASDPAEELADCLMMVMVCSKSLGIDVVEVLLEKMERKTKQYGQPISD